MEHSTRRRRRTQAERREETRTALLEATIECLVTHGYANTTTGRIADVAGVSRGAQALYFRTRAELVGAAVAHLADKRIAAVRERFAPGPVSLVEALDVLWEEHQGVVFAAALEIWVAARTDPKLRAVLHHVERDVMAAISREAVTAIGEQAMRDGFNDDLLLVLATIRGLTMLQMSNGKSRRSLNAAWVSTRSKLIRLMS